MSSSNNRLNYLIALHGQRKEIMKNKAWKRKAKPLALPVLAKEEAKATTPVFAAGENGLQFQTATKSEARARLKGLFKAKRLRPGTKLTRVA